MAWPDGVAPRSVDSRDGTPIVVFTSGIGPPLLLVHGTAGDHSTFRVIGPRLAASRTLDAMDRRGRGASGDTPPYAIEREFEDVAAVADRLAAETGRLVDVFGHSYGGRCALGAALRTDAIRRVISYEGAPTPPGVTYHPPGLDEALAVALAADDGAEVLATFMRRVVGMTDAELAAYRADPVWPARVAATPTIVRELAAETSPEGSLEALANVRQPVLQILGGASLPAFRAATIALDGRLSDGRIVEIAGARHAAHHTHPDEMVDAVIAFLRD
jgi:pimeloyl-ACP methyl ester carboxylesterase